MKKSEIEQLREQNVALLATSLKLSEELEEIKQKMKKLLQQKNI
ncbi:MAG: hypothetical protein ABIH34_07630 [Nanoarchaeota archaeon]